METLFFLASLITDDIAASTRYRDSNTSESLSPEISTTTTETNLMPHKAARPGWSSPLPESGGCARALGPCLLPALRSGQSPARLVGSCVPQRPCRSNTQSSRGSDLRAVAASRRLESRGLLLAYSCPDFRLYLPALSNVNCSQTDSRPVTLSREDYERLRQSKPGMYPAIDFDSPRRVVSDTVSQPPPVDEPVAAVPREAPRQGRVRICVTSYRLRLADEDNLALGAKPLVDSCVAAGIIPSDSPVWCKIEHRQEQVKNAAEERTEITLENL